MFNLRNISLKLFRAGMAQVITSIVTVAIAIALVVIICSYGFNAKAKFDADIYALYGESDIEFSYEAESGKFIDAYLLNEIDILPDVKAVASVMVNPDIPVEGIQVDLHGVQNDPLTKSRFKFSEDINKGDVLISERLRTSLEKSIGDVLIIDGLPFRIADILPSKSTNTLYITHDDMKDMYPYMQEGELALVQMETDNITEVGSAIAKLDKDLRVNLLNESETVQKNVESLLIFVVVLSVFVLLIAGTLLSSSFRIIFIRLQKQLISLRTIGATTMQVAKILFIQLTTIIVIGVILGTLLGIGVMVFGLDYIISVLHLPPIKGAVPLAIIVKIALASSIVLQVFALWQVWRSSNVLPMQIKQKRNRVSWNRMKTVISVIVLLFALFLLLIGMKNNAPLQSLIGTAMITILLIYILPYLFRRLLAYSLSTVRMTLGKNVYLALQQLIPQLRTNMSIVLTIISVMVILVFSTATMKTVMVSGENYINEKYREEIHGRYDLADITGEAASELMEEFQQMDGIDKAYGNSISQSFEISLPDKMTDAIVYATDLERLNQNFQTPGAIVKKDYAAEHDIKVGDELSAIDYNEDRKVFSLLVSEVSDDPAIFEDFNDMVVDWSEPLADEMHLYEVFVDAESLDDLTPIISKMPAFHFTTKKETLAEDKQMIQQRYVLVIGTIVVLITGASLGVLQTLMNETMRYGNNYRIKRLLGLTQNGMMLVIIWQAFIFVLYGSIFGVLFGVFFTKLFWFVIDNGASTLIDIPIILYTLSTILLLTLVSFSLQGYLMSRRSNQYTKDY